MKRTNGPENHKRPYPCMRRLRGTGAVLVIMFALASLTSAAGQVAGKPSTLLSDFQGWDELDISAKLVKDADVSWVSQGRFSTQFPNPATYLSGVDLNLSVGRRLVLTPSY